MNNPSQPNIRLVNAPDYRETYANSVQVRVNVWDFFLVFGTLQQQSETQVEVKQFSGHLSEPAAGQGTDVDSATERLRLREHIRRDQARSPNDDSRTGALACSGSRRRDRAADSKQDPNRPDSLRCSSLCCSALHAPLLRLPYFWDEAGYYVPAARDLLLHGTLIPRSTPSNAHPPLVMAYLALAWKLLGYSPWVTRTAMLGVAAFSLLGVFRLAQRVANTEVAVASAVCTALYPGFLCPKLPRSHRSCRGWIELLGFARIRRQPAMDRSPVVLPGSARQRNRYPGTTRFVRLGVGRNFFETQAAEQHTCTHGRTRLQPCR